MVASGEILRVDKQGLHYNGQTVADGGAAHAAWMATVKLMHSASFLGANVTPQAVREFVEWASEIFARYTSLKPDAGDTPEVQEETAESIQRDQAYLDAFVAACKEAQGMQQSALETSRRIDLEENQRKNNVALDTLSAAVDELRKERDAFKADLARVSGKPSSSPSVGPVPGWLKESLGGLAAERDAARAELVVLGSACNKFRIAESAMRIERDAAKRELAEVSAALDAVLRERTELRLQIDRWRSRSSTTDGEAQA